MRTCDKCLKEVKDKGDGVSLIIDMDDKDITNPRLIEVYLHTECLLELIRKNELKEFLERLKKERRI
ncbi:hypothetical protein DRO35_04805 [Candidatus Bathyarchaeota archaeon]|nr:MAG: hypothetical protein DRO35_04805 [Candidatus Bathyarchaeota archaeon]